MRTARMLGGVAIVFLSASAAHADPTSATITLPEVTVRSGPSPEFYPTSKLRKGDKVRVLREEFTGWLEIAPPEGSFSWIDTRLVKPFSAIAAVVSAPQAQIWVGSRLVNSEPTVYSTTAVKGTLLTVIGKAERARDGLRLPILPVPAEHRYIPAEAIRPSAASQQVAAATPEPTHPASVPASTAPGFVSPKPAVADSAAGLQASPTTGSSSAPALATGANPLWLQADEAERAGDLVRAQELLKELAVQVRQTDPQLWVHCLNRMEDLRNRDRGPARPAPMSGLATANTNRGRVGEPLVPAGPSAPAPATYRPAQRTPSEYCYLQDPGYTARLSPPILHAPSPAPSTEQWSDVGRLHRTGFTLPNGNPVFCLQPTDPNKRYLYVAASPEVNLRPYVEKIVYLYGPVIYHGELRNNLMTAMQVNPVR